MRTHAAVTATRNIPRGCIWLALILASWGLVLLFGWVFGIGIVNG